MKISINIADTFSETEVTINCRQMSEDLEKVIASLRMLDMKLTGIRDGQTYILDAAKILYIDTADKKTFMYTKTEVYETPLKLYELEQQLAARDFFRASKSCVINFNKITSLRSDIDGKLIVAMENGERLVVSRQYASFVKNKLGV